MNQFMLILRNETFQWKDYSPEEYQQILSEFRKWYKDLEQMGLFEAGGKLLEENGITLRMKEDQVITDGPYCESKEAVAGFFIILAHSYDKAKEIASSCPMLSLGGSIEIRLMELDFHRNS